MVTVSFFALMAFLKQCIDALVDLVYELAYEICILSRC